MDNAVKLFKTHLFPKSETPSNTNRYHLSLQSFVKKLEKSVDDPKVLNKRAILREVDETLSELRYARECFENASEPEIVEACIYKIKSAEARYSYLLRKAKESCIERCAFKA